MALTTQQLCLINSLMYSSHPDICSANPTESCDGMTLGEMVERLNPGKNDGDALITEAEWNNIVQAVKNDPQLSNVQIKSSFIDTSNGDGRCLLVDPSTNEAVVAFRGTGGGEWKDNFIAGTTMDGGATVSPQQQKAVDYVNSLDLSGYDTVTVTGHSKGGNKAKLAALECDQVDRCVSFDGQGFSDEFLEAHKDEIARNQHKIENHNADGDYVNILLNDIGETTYYKAQHCEGDLLKNHSPASMLDDNCNMIEGPQSKDMARLDRFLNSMLRDMDPDQRAEALDFAGDVAAAVRGSGSSSDKLREVLLDPRNTEAFSDVLAYTLAYEHETGNITDTISHVLSQMGKGDIAQYIDIAQKIIGNDFAYGLIAGVAKVGDNIPDKVLDYLRDKFNIPLSGDELRQLLRIVALTGEKMDDFNVHADNGADKVIESKPTTPSGSNDSSSSTPTPPHTPWHSGGWLDNFTSGIIFFVQFNELRASCEELTRAVAYYNDAIEELRNAANELSQNWIGDGRDAFVANQEEAFGWYVSMADIVTATAKKLLSANSAYREAEERLSGIIRGR